MTEVFSTSWVKDFILFFSPPGLQTKLSVSECGNGLAPRLPWGGKSPQSSVPVSAEASPSSPLVHLGLLFSLSLPRCFYQISLHSFVFSCHVLTRSLTATVFCCCCFWSAFSCPLILESLFYRDDDAIWVSAPPFVPSVFLVLSGLQPIYLLLIQQ